MYVYYQNMVTYVKIWNQIFIFFNNCSLKEGELVYAFFDLVVFYR